jgi:hypothetical protein
VVDPARYLGEEIGRIGIPDRRGLSDRFAGRLSERGKRGGDREYVFVFAGDAQGIRDEEGALSRDLDGAFSDCAEASGALG